MDINETPDRPIKRTPGPVELPLATYGCAQPFPSGDFQHYPNIDALEAALAELEWTPPAPSFVKRFSAADNERQDHTCRSSKPKFFNQTR
ncbi:hypothetical protein [Notoacmeibacter sp. MSK16QG-6]|uniref:hypothetical protein n=1 Tax=Notoacmeibacter sp. MSK16QG-6 TaxID=2957982 RepID=UPI00209FE8DE|nr:hypothetical protein [Notoacmeibacter sp. MSK16QG-6]MCP1200615.1 hypothetical protein [Notoacmeibacter sp. MSK16QG-6]